MSARHGNTCNNQGDHERRACTRSSAHVHLGDMKRIKAAFVIAIVAGSIVSLAIGCSSSSSDSGSGSDASTGGDGSSGGGDGGGGGEGGNQDGAVIDSGGKEAGYGVPCAGPAGQAGGCTDSVYNTCEMDGPGLICTKTCTYPGGGGPQPDPSECPNPPTSGDCTPKGFCK